MRAQCVSAGTDAAGSCADIVWVRYAEPEGDTVGTVRPAARQRVTNACCPMQVMAESVPGGRYPCACC